MLLEEIYNKVTKEQSMSTRKKRREIRKFLKKTGIDKTDVPDNIRIIEIHGSSQKVYLRCPYGEDVDAIVQALPGALWQKLNSGLHEYGFKSVFDKTTEVEVYTYNVTCSFEEQPLPQEEWVTKRNTKVGCTPVPKPK